MPAVRGPKKPTVTRGDAAYADAQASFRFVPEELAARCRTLIKTYHAARGYSCLPDMLWHSEARAFIDDHEDLRRMFNSAAKTRCAKQTNNSLLFVATIIVALEVLARDISNWGARFPREREAAIKLLGVSPLHQRAWLVDRYLRPSHGSSRPLQLFPRS